MEQLFYIMRALIIRKFEECPRVRHIVSLAALSFRYTALAEPSKLKFGM